ncbi:transcriptional regulator, TetR family [Williamsia deligens]|nr:transcriptional regulator, TetR family [Williamsia deligens]
MVRDEVVRAATRLFTERGIRGVSLQDIADEVELTKGALYHYFNNRDDLLRQVFGDWITGEFTSLQEHTSRSGTATDKLRDYVRYHVSSVVDNIELYSLSFSSEAELPPEVRTEFRHLKRRSDSVLKDILSQGVSDGEFELRDEKVIAFAIDGMCNWLCQWYVSDGPKSATEIANDFNDLLLRGLLRGDGDESPVQSGRTHSPAEAVEYHARAIRFHSERLEQLLPSLTGDHPGPTHETP